jgi:hypothetical protein
MVLALVFERSEMQQLALGDNLMGLARRAGHDFVATPDWNPIERRRA